MLKGWREWAYLLIVEVLSRLWIFLRCFSLVWVLHRVFRLTRLGLRLELGWRSFAPCARVMNMTSESGRC